MYNLKSGPQSNTPNVTFKFCYDIYKLDLTAVTSCCNMIFPCQQNDVKICWYVKPIKNTMGGFFP